MKIIHHFLLPVFGILAFMGCKKGIDPVPATTPSKIQSVRVEFVDHTTGEPVNGLELLFGQFSDIISDPGNFKAVQSRLTNTDGSTNFVQPLRPTFIKPNNKHYADITYIIDGTEPYNGDVLPFKKCKLLRMKDGVSYYRAELYRLSPVDIHIKQVTELILVDPWVYVKCSAEDPTDSLSKYYMHKSFNFGGTLKVMPGKKMDTVLRAYAFSDLENAVDWSVYVQSQDPWDGEFYEYWYNGSIEKKKYSLPGPASVTITF